jgi:HPt (histidine-containing phosphotransfer) domain-containing protein
MIDWDRLRELRNEIGTDEFAEVVEIFLEEVDSEITMLRNQHDLKNLEAQLHFLKGSALNLGFVDFSALCQHGEFSASCGQADLVDVQAILKCYTQSRSAFIQGLPDLDTT